MPPRLFSPAEAEKLAQLRQADTEGRKQAHIESIYSAIKTAAQAQARAHMGLEKDAFPLAAPAKAAAGAVGGAAKKVGGKLLSLVRGGAGKAVAEATHVGRPALTAIEGGVARAAHPVIPPPAGSMRAGAAEAGLRRAPAAPPPIPQQAVGGMRSPVQQMPAAKAGPDLQRSLGGLRPAQRAEIAWSSSPGIRLSHSAPVHEPYTGGHGLSELAARDRPMSSGHLGAPQAGEDALTARMSELAPQGTGRALGGTAPTGRVERGLLKAPKEQAQAAQAEVAKASPQPAATPSRGGPTPAGQLQSFANTAKRGLNYAKSTAKGLGYGALLGTAALGYGAYKMAPHVLGALGGAASYPMAPGGGWSPVDYGYGSNPYGPGAVNLGPGA